MAKREQNVATLLAAEEVTIPAPVQAKFAEVGWRIADLNGKVERP